MHKETSTFDYKKCVGWSKLCHCIATVTTREKLETVKKKGNLPRFSEGHQKRKREKKKERKTNNPALCGECVTFSFTFTLALSSLSCRQDSSWTSVTGIEYRPINGRNVQEEDKQYKEIIQESNYSQYSFWNNVNWADNVDSTQYHCYIDTSSNNKRKRSSRIHQFS